LLDDHASARISHLESSSAIRALFKHARFPVILEQQIKIAYAALSNQYGTESGRGC
jgi:hypothetical protein